MLKVVVIGYGDMFCNIIAGTLDSGSKIVGVFRHDRVKMNNCIRWIKDIINPDSDYNYVKSYNLHEIKAKSANSNNFRKQLLKLNPDIVLVASWSEKLTPETFNLPKIATINVHPSLLPRYRGPNPYVQTILHLEEKSGVTFHLVDSKIDRGSILDQRVVEIKDSYTGKELKGKTVLAARGAVCELLEKLSEDVVFPVSQNERLASYYPAEYEPELDFTKTSREISAQIRAIHPWGKTFFFIGNLTFVPDPYKIQIEDNTTEYSDAGTIVTKSLKDNSIKILCGDNKLIKLSGLKQHGLIQQFFTKQAISKVDVGKMAMFQ